MNIEKLVQNMADKTEEQVLREEWEGMGKKVSIKNEIEKGAYFLTPEPWLTWSYALLAKGAISKQELLASMKIGADYYKSKESLGELGWKTRIKRADEVLQQLKKEDVKEVMGYRLPEPGDVMLRESMRYVGFCSPDAARQEFPTREPGSRYEISLPPIALINLEKQLVKRSPKGLHLFPKMKSSR